MNIIQALNVGLFAQKLLNTCGICTVWGNTSRGIFLKINPEGLMFLSYEKFKGPYTVNVPSSLAAPMRDLEPGDQVVLGPDQILRFDDQGLGISIGDANPWQPEAFLSTVDEKELSGNLKILAGWLKSYTPTGSFGYMSSSIGSGDETGVNGIAELNDKVREIYRSISISDDVLFNEAASNVVGLGSGLTPSGDDFLTGMSLAISRYSHVINKLKNYSTWFEELSPAIKLKTTILSSALFVASLQGSADERLIEVFDSIMGGKMIESKIIPSISSWGSSSGYDALAGFYLLMKAIYP